MRRDRHGARGDLTWALQPGALVLAAPREVHLRLDAEGRWATFRPDAVPYRRAVSGEVAAGRGRPQLLAPPEAQAVHATLLRLLKELLPSLLSSHPARPILERACTWTPERLAAEAERFRRAYPEAVPILPPDRYRDLVVLPSVGCPNARCNFCAFYQGRPFRVLSPDAFQAHLQAVRAFFGAALAGRDGLFLGSASALSLGDRRLAFVLEAVRRTFGTFRRGVAAFLDPERAPRRTAATFGHLAELGLRHVTVGLETGEPAARRRLGKSPNLGRLAGQVAAMKDAGLRVGLTVLVSPVLGPRHAAATASFLAELPLTPADAVYLSPLVGPRVPPVREDEVTALRRTLQAATPARLVPYRQERFRYWA